MVLPSVFRPLLQVSKSTRILSRSITIATSDRLDVTLDEQTGICRMVMQNKPVNILERAMLCEMREVLNDAQTSSRYKAIVISSSLPKVYCAGLDIQEILRAGENEEHFRTYWDSFLDVVYSLYSMKPLTVASIGGTSPAGGCVLGLACDYRILAAGKHRIGLNEPILNVDVPKWLCTMVQNVCGSGPFMRSLVYGHLYRPDEALAIDLVDVVCQPEQLSSTTENFVNNVLKIPELARITTKKHLRDDCFQIMKANRDTEHKVQLFQKQEVIQTLERYVAALGPNK